MTTIRARCRTCGDVELAPRDVTVVTIDGVGTFRFRCPRCHAIVIRRCDAWRLEQLAAAGCVRQVVDLTFESTSPAAPITHDDLLDFHQALYDDAVFVRAVDSIEGSTA